MTETALGLAGRAMKSAWAMPDDWEQFRNTIKQLYLDQNKSLKEVMGIMDRDHDFHATIKMYKSRITQWGFDKKNKASDMEFVLRKKMNRDAVHKNTIFTVRGRPLDMKAFSNYVKRHHLLERITIEASTADTPEHISYQTPATSPHPQAEINELNAASSNGDGRLEEVPYSACLSDYNLGRTTVPGDGRTRQNTQTALFVGEVQDLYHWLFDGPNLTRTLALPESMRLSERLFLLIPTYIAGAFRKGVWNLNTRGYLISTTLIGSINPNVESLFNDNFIFALEALDRRRFIEARQALKKAFALMASMIRYDLPTTLRLYLVAISIMTGRGFSELADMLRRHMKDVAALVLPPQNPASQIYAVMSDVDPNQLRDVLDKALQCRNNSLARNLAPFGFDLISSEIDSIKIAHRNSPMEVENRLRTLLFECEQRCGYDSASNLIVKYAIINNLIEQGRPAEAEAMSQDVYDRARHSEFLPMVLALELLAGAQHASGRLPKACKTLSSAIDMSRCLYGRNYSWSIRFKLKLEKWLREGGKEQEADALRLQLDELMDDSGS